MDKYLRPPKLKKCCVRNCTDKESVRHRLPNPKRDFPMFNSWLQIIQPFGFETLSREQQYNRYYVCNRHFAPQCFVPGTRRGLRLDSVPTMNLPECREKNTSNNETDAEDSNFSMTNMDNSSTVDDTPSCHSAGYPVVEKGLVITIVGNKATVETLSDDPPASHVVAKDDAKEEERNVYVHCEQKSYNSELPNKPKSSLSVQDRQVKVMAKFQKVLYDDISLEKIDIIEKMVDSLTHTLANADL